MSYREDEMENRLEENFFEEDLEESDELSEDDWRDEEPDIDAQFEHDSTMESIGWGTDEQYDHHDIDSFDNW